MGPADTGAAESREPGPLRIVWNHRWEHDKGPDAFFGALDALVSMDVDFEVIVLGESFAKVPPIFEEARVRLGERVIHFGYADSRGDYARWLNHGDVVVSTARHEFFGASVCEAMYCGCAPLLPHKLAYPELVPEALRTDALYDTPDEMVARLASYSALPPATLGAESREVVKRFDWRHMAPAYDSLLAELASYGCEPDVVEL
jgi:glycosyltransferase involved in cell wall biosynthesis